MLDCPKAFDRTREPRLGSFFPVGVHRRDPRAHLHHWIARAALLSRAEVHDEQAIDRSVLHADVDLLRLLFLDAGSCNRGRVLLHSRCGSSGYDSRVAQVPLHWKDPNLRLPKACQHIGSLVLAGRNLLFGLRSYPLHLLLRAA